MRDAHSTFPSRRRLAPEAYETLKGIARDRIVGGEKLKAVAKSLGLGESTVQAWAKAGGWRKKDRKLMSDALAHLPEEKRGARATQERSRAQQREALSAYDSGRFEEADRLMREADKTVARADRFERLRADLPKPGGMTREEARIYRNAFILHLNGETNLSPERVAKGPTGAQHFALWQIVPPYWDKLKALGAVEGRAPWHVVWPDGMPPAEELPERPDWLTNDPWEPYEDWMAGMGKWMSLL